MLLQHHVPKLHVEKSRESPYYFRRTRPSPTNKAINSCFSVASRDFLACHIWTFYLRNCRLWLDPCVWPRNMRKQLLLILVRL